MPTEHTQAKFVAYLRRKSASDSKAGAERVADCRSNRTY